MKLFSIVVKIVVILLIFTVFAVGTLSFAKKLERKCVTWPGWVCFEVYDPVKCSDGVVYSNACFARKACAKGCKPVSI